jgi:hypothetical protein
MGGKPRRPPLDFSAAVRNPYAERLRSRLSTVPYDDDVMECTSCGMGTSWLEARLRKFRECLCGHCGGSLRIDLGMSPVRTGKEIERARRR